jgi:alkylresorcinol/alkylpyrone synthase
VAGIAAVQTALPAGRHSQQQLRAAAARIFGDSRYLSVFEHAGVRRRALARPLEEYERPRSFEQRNREATEAALELAVEAARGLTRGIETLATVTTTVLATPSLDTMLMRRLEMDPAVRRVPLFGVGCAGGAAGLARAAELAAAGPVLLVSAEVCSLTFNPRDASPVNVVASALFGDGAAAVRLEEGARGPRVVRSASRLFPDSERVMGWEFTGEGMRLVLSTEVPGMVRRHLAPMVRGFVEDRPIAHWILHPGGARVLDAYAEALGLGEEALAPSRGFLAEHGNLSSACVLFILRELWDRGRPGEFGLVVSVGPGFAGELVLLQW